MSFESSTILRTIFPVGHEDFCRIFVYVHNEMGLSHELIARTPQIFNQRLKLTKTRHEYLKTLDRAQYDPTKPLFVPLRAFYELNDADFCMEYAKTSVNDFNAYLKSL